MGTLLNFLIIYVALIFGFQYTNAVAPLVGQLFSISDLPTQQVIGVFAMGIPFLLIMFVIKNKLFPNANSSGCLITIPLVLALIWFAWVFYLKAIVFIDPALTLVSFVQGNNPAEQWIPAYNNFLWNERVFDQLIQVWFPRGENYILFQAFLQP